MFTSPRRVRFLEMEYAIPRAAIREALADADGFVIGAAQVVVTGGVGGLALQPAVVARTIAVATAHVGGRVTR